MKFNKNDIEGITLGALMIVEDDEYLAFSRFTESQMRMLEMRGKEVILRARCTASVKFEFYTRGGQISFDFEISPGINREYYSIDLLIDKTYRYSLSKDKNIDTDTFEYIIPNSVKEQRVTIYFPTTVCMKIKNLKLPKDADPHKRKTRILVLGDSLSQGYNPNHFQNTCMNVFSDFFDADMINQGIGGDCFNKDNIYKIEPDPDFIIVEYGINDWASGRFKNGEDAKVYFERLNEIYPDKVTFAILPSDNDYLEKTRKNDDLLFKTDNCDFGNQRIENVRNVIYEIVKEYKNVIPINAKDFVQQYPEFFYSDNVHFTDLGNYIYGNALASEINKYYIK